MAEKGKPEKINTGPWQIAYFCVKCKAELSTDTRMYSHGMCPFCGNYTPGTIVATTLKARRKIYTYVPSWWERIFYFKKPVWHWEEKPTNAVKK